MRPARESQTAVAICAAGRGERAGGREGPKQFRRIGGTTVLERTIRAFASHPGIGEIAVAIHPDDEALFAAATGELAARVTRVHGGASRQASVLNALRTLARSGKADRVLIHDGARPFLDHALIDRIVGALQGGTGVVPAIAVSDTLKRAGADGLIARTEERNGLYAAQTPQAFPLRAILAAHETAAIEAPDRFTDDSMLAEWAGIPVRIVEGSPENVKLTWAKDFEMAERRLASGTFPDVRVGSGYDVHRLEPGSEVQLCGVAIPHDRRLVGHSDADAGLHALTDALLATCGEGDIGTHFPPSDPRWRGAASRLFLETAARLVRARGGRIANVDVTLVAEAPRIGPHRARMAARIAEILAIAPERVSIKATTNEGMGFLGRGEGIAALASASVIYPGGLEE